jgi:hypothetical protein
LSPSGAGDDSIEDNCEDRGVLLGEGYDERSRRGCEKYSGGGEGEVEKKVSGEVDVLDALDAKATVEETCSFGVLVPEDSAKKRVAVAYGVVGEKGGCRG